MRCLRRELFEDGTIASVMMNASSLRSSIDLDAKALASKARPVHALESRWYRLRVLITPVGTSVGFVLDVLLELLRIDDFNGNERLCREILLSCINS